jgi:hypothetical protein
MDKLDENFFITPGVNLQENDSELRTVVHLPAVKLRDRWNTTKGRAILTRWQTNGFRRDVLNDLVGKFYNHTDIRGIDLSGESLQSVDLSYIDFFCADLTNTTFERYDLTERWLSQSDLSGTQFIWAPMNNVLIDDVEFDNRIKFIGVNLASVNFTLAALVKELAIGQQKIEHLERRSPYFAMFLRLACDYGRSFRRFLICCVGVIFVFSLVHYFIPDTINYMGFFRLSLLFRVNIYEDG